MGFVYRSVGLSLVFIYEVSFGVLWCLLMWVVVSSESSVVVSTGSLMSIGLNLLDNQIGSFISFCLVWIFPFLCLGVFS